MCVTGVGSGCVVVEIKVDHVLMVVLRLLWGGGSWSSEVFHRRLDVGW